MSADGESYEARVVRALTELGIPASYGAERRMPLYPEESDLVSAFRSLEYQRGIFERKLAAGQPLEQILQPFRRGVRAMALGREEVRRWYA